MCINQLVLKEPVLVHSLNNMGVSLQVAIPKNAGWFTNLHEGNGSEIAHGTSDSVKMSSRNHATF